MLEPVSDPSVDNGPTAPPDSPAAWTLLAATRKESLGTSTPLAAVTNQVTDGLDAGAKRPLAALAAAPATVVAIPQTPPLAWLQQLPVVGPVLVTPIVAAIHLIPIVGDIVHPLIGYPVQPNQPPGAPVSRDVRVISFDGTQIAVHFMPAVGLLAGERAPTILDGPGLGMPGATNLNGTLLDGVLTDNLGAVGVASLRNAGYNVVTWDPRGEYFSGGVLQIDSPDFEGRDVSAIISWLATQPEVRLDGDPANLDPRIGMVGASYGGAIQLVTAATDHRIDAIVPTIAYNSLNTSLYKSEAFKSGWGTLLEGALLATFARANPRLLPAAIYGDLTGMVSQSDQELLADRGPGGVRNLVGQITAPTLLIQGTVDTLFTLQEADANAKALLDNGVPTKVLWFCGGHGVCVNNLLDPSDGVLVERRTLQWLDRYVKGDPTVPTGPQFEWVDQRGQYFSSNVYPVSPGRSIVAASTGGVLPLLPVLGGSGPLLFVLPIGGMRASNALSLTIPGATTTTYVVGAPQLTLTYSGTGVSRHVYAQLVDDTTGVVLGNQVTPIPVELDGQDHTLSIALEPVAQTLRTGETVTLQLVASAATYETLGSLGELKVSSMQLTLPTADATAVSPDPVLSPTAAV